MPPRLDEDEAAYFDRSALLRLTPSTYHDLLATGVLKDEATYELLEGLLVETMPEDPIHMAVTLILMRLLGEATPADCSARPTAPVAFGDSEPKPDVSVVRGTYEDYRRRHPAPEDTLLLVEVANTSHRRDRGWKQRIYARAGTREYWIADVVARRLEVYRDPTGPDIEEPYYRSRTIYDADATVDVPIDGATPISLADVFGDDTA